MEKLTTQSSGEWVAIIKACEASGEKFTDESFPPQLQSLSKESAGENMQKFLDVEWKRASELYPGGVTIAPDNLAPEDIVQGCLGDCYLVSCLAALA